MKDLMEDFLFVIMVFSAIISAVFFGQIIARYTI